MANDAGQWHDAIVRLIDDETLRTRIQRHARQYVREHYAQEKFEGLFLEQIREVLGRPAASRPLRRRESAAATGQPPAAGFLRRLAAEVRRSLATLRRVGPRQAWTALRWMVNDRCLAAWLRWQLWQ